MLLHRKSIDKDIGVTHWVDATNTWYLGFTGFFIRLRGLISSILLGLPLAGLPFWWNTLDSSDISISPRVLLFSSLALLLLMITCLFFYTRSSVRKALRIKSLLHTLEHNSRDALSNLYRRTNRKKKPSKASEAVTRNEEQTFRDFASLSCRTIADFYRELLREESVGCAIRIAATVPNNGVSYVTIGRYGLNESRKESSEGIPASAGIPSFFRRQQSPCKGVLLYHDIDKAIQNNAYLKTKNDEQFREEIKYMAVAPINAWNGNDVDLIGLLYITARSAKAIDPRNIDVIRFSADHLALTFSSMLSRLEAVKSKPQFS